MGGWGKKGGKDAVKSAVFNPEKGSVEIPWEFLGFSPPIRSTKMGESRQEGPSGLGKGSHCGRISLKEAWRAEGGEKSAP